MLCNKEIFVTDVTAMLLITYFLSLLLCVNIVFCYDYIENGNVNFKKRHRTIKSSDKKWQERKQNNQKHRRSNTYNDEPKVRIDVASFIQGPEETRENSNLLQEPELQRVFNEYIDSGYLDETLHKGVESLLNYDDLESYSINENNVGKDDLGESTQMNVQPVRDDNKSIFSKNDLKKQVPHHYKHKPERKCIFKNMRIPFFSRKLIQSSASPNVQKNTKKRLVGFNHSRKNNLKVRPTAFVTDEGTRGYDKLKRSYLDILCPQCKRKNIDYNADDDKEHLIHNSREYYKQSYFNKGYNNLENMFKE